MFPTQSNSRVDWRVFTPQGSVTLTNGWVPYHKPPGCSWLSMIMIAAGGGGGKGAGGAATVAAGGGGSGGITRFLIPALFLPDRFWVRPGSGGLGATSSGTGTVGTSSYVSLLPSNATTVSLILAQVGGNGGGGAGTNTLGSAGSAVTVNMAFTSYGILTSISGMSGTIGAAAANGGGTNIIAGVGIPITGGAGGGNGLLPGGYINNTGQWPQINGGAGTTGGDGLPGFQRGLNILPGIKGFPFLFSGGSGGGGHSTGAAGAGGHGAWGCGGGGGGNSSTAGGTAGNGGNGGDGVIMIGAW